MKLKYVIFGLIVFAGVFLSGCCINEDGDISLINCIHNPYHNVGTYNTILTAENTTQLKEDVNEMCKTTCWKFEYGSRPYEHKYTTVQEDGGYKAKDITCACID
ncbi:hypothetical protein KAW38_03570 [Candidatus Micrarchaeota archaeon]|nr:hypothetical protein [Candidatus Micrarchaeota archaeon]